MFGFCHAWDALSGLITRKMHLVQLKDASDDESRESNAWATIIHGPIEQKIQWNSSKDGAREKALAKLPISKIEGPAPQFWKKAPPLKNDQFRGQKHLENAPKKFYTIRTYIKFTFCKKIGPNRPILPSAVVQIFHCRSYGVPTTN